MLPRANRAEASDSAGAPLRPPRRSRSRDTHHNPRAAAGGPATGRGAGFAVPAAVRDVVRLPEPVLR
ncbi:hypothetical protein JCM9534A_36550 [Catenuloplanes indicus JCM 9534]